MRSVCGPRVCGHRRLEENVQAVEKGKDMPPLAMACCTREIYGAKKNAKYPLAAV